MADKIYCEDCAHFREASGVSVDVRLTLGRCAKEKSAIVGLRYVARCLDIGGYADMTRAADYLCGPTAVWFEPKQVAP